MTCLKFIIAFMLSCFAVSSWADAPSVKDAVEKQYLIGAGDVLVIDVLQPDKVTSEVTVSPDGAITFAYIGSLNVRDKTLTQVQRMLEKELSNGYMKYPVVTVSLKSSQSRKFYVYGEVMRPGPYFVDENMTVLRAMSEAGGFTKFGSSSRVKVLRPKKGQAGYDTIKVNIKEVMSGNSGEDVVIESGDIIVVSEGVF